MSKSITLLTGRLLRPLRASGPVVDPQAFVRSIPERWLDPVVRSHVMGMELIRQACVESYAFPEKVSPAFRTEMHFARRHVYHLKDVSVSLRTGACAASGLFFQESYGSLRRCLLEAPFPAGRATPRCEFPIATCVGAAPFYHFLLEEVPRLLWTLRSFSDLDLLVHQSAPRYAMEIVEAVAARHGCRISVSSGEALFVPGFVFTQSEAYSGFVHGDDLVLLREELMPRSQPDGQHGLKIYVTRQKATRSFDNEDGVEALMRQSGFEVCILEDLSFERQVSLFRRAGVIVAPHGGGLANLVWCCPGTRVIEIFSPRYFNDCFARLACTLRLGYEPLFAASGGNWGRVPLDELAAAVAGEKRGIWP